jgi:hypothetical protein
MQESDACSSPSPPDGGNLVPETTLRHDEHVGRSDALDALGDIASHEPTALHGELAFASAEARAQRTAELLGDGAIVVEVASPAASIRGRLGEHIDYLVERALGIRGAPAPYLESWSMLPDDADASVTVDAGARLADQLFRARSVGATGIAVAIGSLARVAAPALTPEDSASLRSLSEVALTSAVVLLLDDGDEELGAYREPVALGGMLGIGKRTAETEAGTTASVEAESVETERAPESVVREADAVIAEVCVASEAELVETHVDAPVAERAIVTVTVDDVAKIEIVESVATTESIATTPSIAKADKADKPDKPDKPARAEKGQRDAARRRQTAGVPVSGPSDYWRSWAIALGAARGPQALASFERLFVDSYMPLANAIACGLDDARALRAHDEFREGFERSYTDAFATFGATGRRPRLVMDAYDVAVKQARLHNARTTHVLVVDAMRHDLGCLVKNELAAGAAGVASLTNESLLWSALPTTTFRQLETLARGMDALRAPAAEEGSESLRGRSAETVRRLRVGSRELYKLDVVPSMLGALPDPASGPGPAHVVAALEDIAASVADALLRHIETLPPRTLLLVLGDHGFIIDRHGRITHGGASPEEVLVPCLAYLVGDLH